MMTQRKQHFFIPALLIFLGLTGMGYLLANAIIQYKQLDRSVTVKGLSEREVPATVVIWPISFSVADNQLADLYVSVEGNNQMIVDFLLARSIPAEAISFSPPAITDKQAQNYGGNAGSPYRFVGQQTVTVYSTAINTVRQAMTELSELGKQGIVIRGDDYENRTEYLFTGLNDIKPVMIEEATRNARQVAEKFAADSASSLGKIKLARQGQFSITDRDQNNPHIKKVRVVSTIEYYLSD